MTRIDPVASATDHAASRRTPGALKGRIKIHERFDELPPDIAAAFGLIEDELAELKKRNRCKHPVSQRGWRDRTIAGCQTQQRSGASESPAGARAAKPRRRIALGTDS